MNIQEVERAVVANLTADPQDLSELMNAVLKQERVAPAQVKVAALNLVSQGRVVLDKQWRLSNVDPASVVGG